MQLKQHNFHALHFRLFQVFQTTKLFIFLLNQNQRLIIRKKNRTVDIFIFEQQ